MKKLIVFGFVVILFLSCAKDENYKENRAEASIEGMWEYDSQEEIDSGYVTIYRKVDVLGQKTALVIEKNHIFKSWDSGWCGTPPLTFHLTEGKYKLNNGVIHVEMNHYFLNNAKLQIISIDADNLKVKRL